MNKQGPGKIGWCDVTWNPVTGCWGPGGTKDAPNWCPYCYARRIATRFGRTFEPHIEVDRLNQPLKEKTPSRVFVVSMGDLWGAWVPREWQEKVLEVVRKATWHTFLFLTKNPDGYDGVKFPPNAWVGVTAETREKLEERKPMLLHAHAPVFVSVEPCNGFFCAGDFDGLDWVIVGGESGGVQDDLRKAAIEGVIGECRAKGIPCFVKANTGLEVRAEWPEANTARVGGTT